MSLKNLGLTPSPLVCTICELFLYVLKILLLVFWGLTPGLLVHTLFALCLYMMKISLLVFLHLTFSHQQELSPTHFNTFALKLKFGIYSPNFKISFTVFFTLVLFCAHSIFNIWALSYSITRHAQMGEIWQPSDYGRGPPDPSAFIHFVNSREPMSHKLWCHRIDRIWYKVYPAVHI